MLIKRISSILVVALLVMSVAVVPVLATADSDGSTKKKNEVTEETDNKDTENNTEKDDTAESGEEKKTETDGSDEEVSDNDSEKDEDADAEGDVASEDSEEKDDADKSDESVAEIPETPDVPDKSAVPEAIDASVDFSHYESDVYTVLIAGKGATGEWTLLDSAFFDDAKKGVPTVLFIEPEEDKEHANLTLQLNEDGKWEVTKAKYYGSKLLIIPVAIITFLIILALTVLINLLIIKIHRR